MFWVFCHLSSSHFSVLLISLSASSLCLFSHHFVSLPVHLNPSLHSLSVRLFWIPHLSPVFLVFHVSLPPCSKCVFGLYLIFLYIFFLIVTLKLSDLPLSASCVFRCSHFWILDYQLYHISNQLITNGRLCREEWHWALDHHLTHIKEYNLKESCLDLSCLVEIYDKEHWSLHLTWKPDIFGKYKYGKKKSLSGGELA